MTVSWIAEAAASAIGGADPVVNKPTGTVEFDVMLAIGVTSGTETITPPAGWNTHAQSLNSSEPLFWKIAGAAEPANYTFATSGAGNCIVVISTYRGVDNADPFAGTAGGIATGSASVVIPAATPSIAAFLAQLVAKLTLTTWTPPASAAPEKWDHQLAGVGSTAGGDELVGAGSTGTRTWIAAAGAASGVGYSVPLREFVSPPGQGQFAGAYEFAGSGFAGQAGPGVGGFSGAYDFSGSGFTGEAPGSSSGEFSGAYSFDGSGFSGQAGPTPPIPGTRPPVTAGGRLRFTGRRRRR